MSRVVRILFVGWLLLMVWVAWGYLSPDADRRKVGIAELRREFESIPVFPGSVPAGEFDAVQKFGLAFVRQRFQAAASFDQIAGYYLEFLPRSGWVHRRSTGIGTGRASVEFCKGSVSFTVGRVTEVEGTTTYGVAATWQGSAHGSTYCHQVARPASTESPSRGG